MAHPKRLAAYSLLLTVLAPYSAAFRPGQASELGLDKIDVAHELALPSGVTPDDWLSIRESISAQRHAFEATDKGFEACNPRFDWVAQFDGSSASIQPAESDWSFGFALRAFGFDGEMREVESPAFGTCVDGQEITYGWTSELSEWWINDQRGFEHGFTVHERPARCATDNASPLTFKLDLLGNLQPRVNANQTGLSLHDDTGLSVLRYDGLVAYDANGAPLSAWLELDDRSLRICVDEAFATYPILVDPVVQDAYIKASNTDAGDRFGISIAASGDTVVVGALGENSNATGIDGNQSNNSFNNAGAAYVFVRSGSSWVQQAYLKASNTNAFDNFGGSVAISGDTIVVGAVAEDSNTTGVNGDQSNNAASLSGAAYVFVRSGTSWTQQAYLKASNTGAGDYFGWSVAASGDTIVVGARFESSNATGIDGDGSNDAALESGAAYVFARSGSTWTQQAYLKASNTETEDYFGYSVAASGDTIVVGAFTEDSNATGIDGDQSNNDTFRAGAAYVFVRSGSAWAQQAYLKASNTDWADFFGYSVAASGDTAVIGALLEDSNATGVDGDQSDNSSMNSGAAYVFVRSGSSWAQTAYLKASNTGASDAFGWSVAATEGAIVVGANAETSSATGINGDQSDNAAIDAGAAYVFVPSSSSWAQAAYLKASNTGTRDEFGYAVAATGGTIVIAAPSETSNATGIDGDQANESTPSAGAVYSFSGAGGVGTPYCMAVANSTGDIGALAGCGSASVARNNMMLDVRGLPAFAFGFFITSTVQDFVMNPGGSEGNLCLGGSIGRYVGPGQIQQADAGGSFSLLLDLTNTPQPNGAVSINAGETWNFQAWHRDTNTMGATSNFTNGLEVLFTM